jgi:hypothetical protein
MGLSKVTLNLTAPEPGRAGRAPFGPIFAFRNNEVTLSLKISLRLNAILLTSIPKYGTKRARHGFRHL